MKKVHVIYVSIITILLILIGILSIKAFSKDSSSNKLETIASNSYIQEKFLDYDLLKVFTTNDRTQGIERIKKQYALVNTMKNNKSSSVTIEQIQNEYEDIFNEEITTDDLLDVNQYKEYYKYDSKNDTIIVKDFEYDMDTEKYEYNIVDTEKDGEIFKVNLEVNKLNIYNSDEKEKVCDAVLKLKIEGNKLILVDYEEM